MRNTSDVGGIEDIGTDTRLYAGPPQETEAQAMSRHAAMVEAEFADLERELEAFTHPDTEPSELSPIGPVLYQFSPASLYGFAFFNVLTNFGPSWETLEPDPQFPRVVTHTSFTEDEIAELKRRCEKWTPSRVDAAFSRASHEADRFVDDIFEHANVKLHADSPSRPPASP